MGMYVVKPRKEFNVVKFSSIDIFFALNSFCGKQRQVENNVYLTKRN